MKLLLDENISWRLATKLKPYFDEVVHINFTNLPKPSIDKLIWNYAKENSFIIVTNDNDFVDLLNLFGFPPKVILIVTGNQSTDYIYNLLVDKKVAIQQLNDTNDYGLVEIY